MDIPHHSDEPDHWLFGHPYRLLAIYVSVALLQLAFAYPLAYWGDWLFLGAFVLAVAIALTHIRWYIYPGTHLPEYERR